MKYQPLIFEYMKYHHHYERAEQQLTHVTSLLKRATELVDPEARQWFEKDSLRLKKEMKFYEEMMDSLSKKAEEEGVRIGHIHHAR